MKKSTFLLFIVLLILSCNRKKGASDGLNAEIPADEATEEERQFINEIKADITQISTSCGVKLDLDRIPITVTSRQDIVTAEGNTSLDKLHLNKSAKLINKLVSLSQTICRTFFT